MKHPTELEFDGGDAHDCRHSIHRSARAVADLRYDRLSEFLFALSAELVADAVADGIRGRSQLAAQLTALADRVIDAAHTADSVWKLCEPFMRDENSK